MKSTIIRGMDERQSVEMRQEFKGAIIFRQRLETILREKMETKRKAVRSPERYKDGAWPYLQADAIGYENALFEVISLLSDDSVEE